MNRARLLDDAIAADNASTSPVDRSFVVPLTKTTTRAFAVSLALVAAGGTIAGAAVFHLPILGLGRTDVASANVAGPSTKRAAPVARKKVHPKVVVKTRYADVVVHVPSSAGVTGAATVAATPMPAAGARNAEPNENENEPPAASEPSEPEVTTTSMPTTTTVAEHDDDSEFEGGHDDDTAEVHEPEDAEHEDVEHDDATAGDSVVHP